MKSATAVAYLPESATDLHFNACLEIKCRRIRAPLNPAPDQYPLFPSSGLPLFNSSFLGPAPNRVATFEEDGERSARQIV